MFGPAGRIVFSVSDSEPALGGDALAFVASEALAAGKLRDMLQPGPVVFFDPLAVMVAEASTIHAPADLAGRTVCLMIGSPGQAALEAFAEARGIRFARLAFQEDVEMLDAYNARRCEAAVGESTYLATMRESPGVHRLTSRLLPTPLAPNPIIVATGRDQVAWSARVFGIIAAVLAGQETPAVGLSPGWLAAANRVVGDYDAIIRRNMVDRLGLVPVRP
jgi:hypothetical protein